MTWIPLRPMLRPLKRRLDRMERHRSALVGDLAGLSEAQLGFRPGPDSWHALEVVEHLVRVEEAIVLRAAQAKPSRTLGEGLRAAGSMVVLRLVMGAGIRIKAPTKLVLPEGTATLPELLERWDRVREKLRAVLADKTAADLHRPMMRHALCGWLTPKQTLSFLEQHLLHHQRQLARIRGADGGTTGRR